MLNFRNTIIAFAILLIGAIILDISCHIPAVFYVFLVIIFASIIFYGCYYIGSQFFLKVACSGNVDKKEIAITFDDGPVENNTLTIINELNRTNTKAAFFCIGKRIESQREIFKKIYNDGHLIGNHSWSHHFWFDMFPWRKMSHDLRQMDMVSASIIGKRPRLFRPPYGVTNPNLARAVKEGNYFPVGWNIRSLDTVITDEEKLFLKLKRSLRPGAIILFHDTSNTTLNILPRFIQHVINEGYKIVRLDALLNIEAYE